MNKGFEVEVKGYQTSSPSSLNQQCQVQAS